MGNHTTTKTLGLTLLALTAAGLGSACSSPSTGQAALPAEVRSIVFLQRKPRTDAGNVFEYTSFVPGGRLVMLSPPAADGQLTDLTALAAKVHNATVTSPSDMISFDGADVMSYDLSFDAKSVVFSARTADSGSYQIFSMNLDGTNLKQLSEGGNDYVYPMYLPGSKIFFTSNRNVENDMTSGTFDADSQQFKDEYERATTAQVGTMNLDGSGLQFGARNVSHRVAPTLLADGHVLYTEWRHMGDVNDGHLRQMNGDMTGMREAFGGEQGGNGGTNSYLKARYVQTIPRTDASGNVLTPDVQLVAVATSRDRTLQSGKLFLIDLNGTEADSKFTDMTPLVPGDRVASSVGRYYDAEIVGDPNAKQFLTSWANGPVESEILDLAKSQANFGLYLFDGNTSQRYPIFDDPNYWDVLARPVLARPEPLATTSGFGGNSSTTIASLNVYDSSVLTIQPGSVQKVRLIEGFSGEEGIDTFGSTEFDGQSLYSELPILADNSFAARVPGNVPFHMQLIDKFAMSVANESIWISGRAGEQRVCGGCHENRSETPQIAPGQIDGMLAGAVNLDVPRPQRITPFVAGSTTDYDFSYGNIRGVPWDKAIQPILDAKCVSCHDGDTTKPGNPSYTVTDMTTGTSQTFNFDLRGTKLNVTVGEKMTGAFTSSYLSIMGLGEILGDDVVTITGDYAGEYGYVSPGSAKDSKIIQMLNPPQRFPAVDLTTRAFASGGVHPTDVGHPEWELTPDEYYRMILNIDMGGQFYFRENKDTASAYQGSN
jgi:Hydrazine synthase alpha subunit middle domain